MGKHTFVVVNLVTKRKWEEEKSVCLACLLRVLFSVVVTFFLPMVVAKG